MQMTSPQQTGRQDDLDLDHEALDWFVRAGPPGSAPSAEFERWLAGHPSRPAAYRRWQADWARLDQLPAAGIDRLRRQLAADQARTAGAPRSPARRAWLPQAALAAVVVGSVGGVLGWSWWQAPVFEQHVETGRGQQRDLALPDGSRLRLDTATRLDVALYRRRREVRLAEGQVVFQVRGDAGRPFDVLAGAVKVTVVGTQFSVRHTGATGVRVAVEEGHVQVTSGAGEGPRSSVDLTAGQMVLADAAGRLLPVAPVPAAGIAPWLDGRLTLDDVPLAQALAEFERYGPTGLVVRDPAVAALRVTGTFDPLRLDNFRRALPQVLPVRLQRQGAQVEIVAAR